MSLGMLGTAPMEPRLRLAFLNGALNALDAVRFAIASGARQQREYNEARRVLEAERQKLLDTAVPR